MEETILTLHPENKQGVRILKRRYDLVKDTIMEVIERDGEITFKALNSAVTELLKDRLDGSIPWYVVTVKLDLEARGIVERLPGASPQRVRFGRGKPAEGDSSVGHDEGAGRLAEAMNMLETLGTEQSRKAHARHGADEPLLGVNAASLRQTAKQLGKDAQLAEQLWNTGNVDARALATLIDDPEDVGAQELDRRVRDVQSYQLADFFATFVSKTRHAVPKMKAWTGADEEYVKRCGYVLVSVLARNAALMDDGTLSAYIDRIEEEIHSSPGRAREAMNKALIDIGRRPRLHDKTAEAAKRIGTVSIEKGDTDSPIPDTYKEPRHR